MTENNDGAQPIKGTITDRPVGSASAPAALKPVSRGRGEGYTITGVILIVLSFASATFPSIGLGPVLTWRGLFLSGTIMLCTGSLIRAMLDAPKQI